MNPFGSPELKMERGDSLKNGQVGSNKEAGLAVYLDIDRFPTKYLFDFWCKIGNPGVIMLLF